MSSFPPLAPVSLRARRPVRAALVGIALAATVGTARAELAICTTLQRLECPAALPGTPDGEFTSSRLIFADNQLAIDDLDDRIGYP